MSLLGPNSETGGVYRRVNDILYHLERYVKLEVAERLSTLTVIIIIAAVCFVFGTSAIFFLCNALVETLNTITGSAMLSYYIITGALVLIILIVLMLRKPLIEKKVVEYYSKSIIETPSILLQDIRELERRNLRSWQRVCWRMNSMTTKRKEVSHEALSHTERHSGSKAEGAPPTD